MDLWGLAAGDMPGTLSVVTTGSEDHLGISCGVATSCWPVGANQSPF